MNLVYIFVLSVCVGMVSIMSSSSNSFKFLLGMELVLMGVLGTYSLLLVENQWSFFLLLLMIVCDGFMGLLSLVSESSNQSSDIMIVSQSL